MAHIRCDIIQSITVWLLLVYAHSVCAQTGPSYCTYSEGLYTCDYTSMGPSYRPIDYTAFSEEPQQLSLTVNGFLPYFGDSQTFSTGFSGIDESQFDPNVPASLTVDCGWSGSAYISAGAFYDMEYIQWFKIKNCDVYYIGLDTVDAFVNLDYFGIEGGSIDMIEPDAFANLTVKKLTSASHSFPRFQGRFEIVNSKFVNGEISPGLLFYFTNLTSVAIKGAGIGSISADTFKYTPSVTRLDISDNLFTNLPSGLFGGLSLLSEVRAFNIEWDCACTRLWWVEFVLSNNISMIGDFVCSSNGQGTVGSHYYKNCYDNSPCAGKSGINIGSTCQSIPGLIILCLSIIACGCSVIALVLAIQNLRDLSERPDPDDIIPIRLTAQERWKEVVGKVMHAQSLQKTLNMDMFTRYPQDEVSYGRMHRNDSIGGAPPEYAGFNYPEKDVSYGRMQQNYSIGGAAGFTYPEKEVSHGRMQQNDGIGGAPPEYAGSTYPEKGVSHGRMQQNDGIGGASQQHHHHHHHHYHHFVSD